MKYQIIFAFLVACYLLFVPVVLAQQPVDQIIGKVTPPEAISKIKGGSGEEQLGTLLSSIIRVFYAAAIIAFVFMFIWAAFQWITSGGDKDALASARKRMVNAIVGLTLLALAFVIFTVIGYITGLRLYTGAPKI